MAARKSTRSRRATGSETRARAKDPVRPSDRVSEPEDTEAPGEETSSDAGTTKAANADRKAHAARRAAETRRKKNADAQDEDRSATRERAKDASDPVRRSASEETARSGRAHAPAERPSPAWLAPTAVVLLVVGLVYLVVYYLSQGLLPLPIDQWNLLVGFGIMGVGGLSLMFWK
jgi:cobalamin biosynthesis Mg chelatase CobN